MISYYKTTCTCLNCAEEQSEGKDYKAEEKLRGKYLKWDGSMPLLKNVLFQIKELTEKAHCKFSMQKSHSFIKIRGRDINQL